MTNSGTPQKGDIWQLPDNQQLRITKVADTYVRGHIRHGNIGRFSKRTKIVDRGPFLSCVKSAA